MGPKGSVLPTNDESKQIAELGSAFGQFFAVEFRAILFDVEEYFVFATVVPRKLVRTAISKDGRNEPNTLTTLTFEPGFAANNYLSALPAAALNSLILCHRTPEETRLLMFALAPAHQAATIGVSSPAI
jgi:hypothetical protein